MKIAVPAVLWSLPSIFSKSPKDVAFHSALSDAHYTSEIMQHLTPTQIEQNSSVRYFILRITDVQKSIFAMPPIRNTSQSRLSLK